MFDFKHLISKQNNKLFTLWISDDNKLPELQYASIKSMILTNHEVTLYTYNDLENIPKGVIIKDGNKILDESKIFKYKKGFNKGSYSGFANWFRVKRLYEQGGTWVDCDIFTIKNINRISSSKIIISTAYHPNMILTPNNDFLRFEKKDKLLKYLLGELKNLGENVVHGQSGPELLKTAIFNKFPEYKKYLTSPEFIGSINYYEKDDFLKPSDKVIHKLKMENIFGFHIWNAMFTANEIILENITKGFYYDLKKSILESQSRKEYEYRIKKLLMTEID